MKLSLIFFTYFLITTQIIFAQEITSNGTWHTMECPNNAIARHECSFVEVDGLFYLLGGRGIKSVSIFNPKTKTWSEGLAPPIEIHHFQGISYKGKIYVIGAMTGKYPYEKPLENILVYNPKLNTWQEGAEIPEARRRGSSGIVVKGNVAIVVSGIVDGHNSTHVPWVDAYNFKTNKWTVLADAPRSRDHFAAAINGNEIYCAGGRNSSFATNQTFDLTIAEVDVYNLKSNTWTTLPSKNNIPTMRAGASVVFLENDLIVIGGESMAQKSAHNNVDAYNIKNKTWRPLDTLNTGRHGSQAIVYKNKIFIAAGSGSRGGKPELDTIEMFEFK